MVGADAFAAAVFREFRADGEGAGFEAFDGVSVGLHEVHGRRVAAGEVGEGLASVGAAGADGDADAGDLGVDFEVGFAADGDAGVIRGSVGDCGSGFLCGGAIRPTLSPEGWAWCPVVTRWKPPGPVLECHA